MSLYPSLEDLKVDQLVQAQHHYYPQQTTPYPPPPYGTHPAPLPPAQQQTTIYPSLGDFMGLDLSNESITSNMPAEVGQQILQSQNQTTGRVSAPVTGHTNMGVMRAEVKQGVRFVVLCKDADGRLGLRVQHVDKGVFVALVSKGSPAAMAGLRFGDQILEINGTVLAGFDRSKVMSLIKDAPADRVAMAIRDRPFERTITLQKDSGGHAGLIFKNGKIVKIVSDSSAARNGLLTDHNLLEVNGQNVVGLKDREILEVLAGGGTSLTLTVIPSFIYQHMVKCLKDSLLRKEMDHSIPDV